MKRGSGRSWRSSGEGAPIDGLPLTLLPAEVLGVVEALGDRPFFHAALGHEAGVEFAGNPQAALSETGDNKGVGTSKLSPAQKTGFESGAGHGEGGKPLGSWLSNC